MVDHTDLKKGDEISYTGADNKIEYYTLVPACADWDENAVRPWSPPQALTPQPSSPLLLDQNAPLSGPWLADLPFLTLYDEEFEAVLRWHEEDVEKRMTELAADNQARVKERTRLKMIARKEAIKLGNIVPKKRKEKDVAGDAFKNLE